LRRSRPDNEPEAIRKSLVDLLTNFAAELKKSDLRAKVIALIPAFHKLRDLGSSLIPKNEAASARSEGCRARMNNAKQRAKRANGK
jgi:hypothetical protein